MVRKKSIPKRITGSLTKTQRKSYTVLDQELNRERRYRKHLRKTGQKKSKNYHYFFESSRRKKRSATTSKPIKVKTHYNRGNKIRKHYRKRPSKSN